LLENEVDVICTILIVEDNEDVRYYVRSCFTEKYKILKIRNGKEAFEIIEDAEPDLIISEVMMPEMDGLQLTKIRKNDIRTCYIPIILLTALASLEHKLEGLEEVSDSYITIHFNSRHLQIRVKKLIEIRSKIRKHFKRNLNFDKTENSLNSLDRKLLNKTTELIDKNILKPIVELKN
jgi:DNA-binding response OmpR family regulator